MPEESARSMVLVRSSMTPVWRLNAPSMRSTSAASACEIRSRLPAIVSICEEISRSMVRRASTSFSRSVSSAWASRVRPSASFSRWPATIRSMSARLPATFARSDSRA